MRLIYKLVPDFLIESVARFARYISVVFGKSFDESIEKKIRGSIVGRRYGGVGARLGRSLIWQGTTIRLGKAVSINAGTQLIAGTRGWVILGNHAHVSRNSVLAGAGGITIGDHTKISSGVMIYTVTYDRSSGGLLRDSPSKMAPVNIGSDVHVGANATILPGVTIGDNAVVAAGAVVNRDVDAGVTVAGVPAKPITSH